MRDNGKRVWLLGAVFATVATAGGCKAAVPIYPGPQRPEAEIAVIEVDRLAFQAVDGHVVNTAEPRYEILPGSHAVTLRRDRLDRGVCFKARAGHVYLARPVRGGGTWHPEVIDENVAQAVHSDEMPPFTSECPGAPPRGPDEGG